MVYKPPKFRHILVNEMNIIFNSVQYNIIINIIQIDTNRCNLAEYKLHLL